MRMERNTYADLHILEHGARVEMSPETLRRDFNESSNEYVICNRPERGLQDSCWRWLLAVKIILLLVVVICMLSLYLQLKFPIQQVQEECAELVLNHSRCEEDVKGEKELTLSLRSNLSWLMRWNNSQQLQEMDRIDQRCQVIHNNYSTLQEQYKELMQKHHLIPREGPLLQNCRRRDTGVDGKVCFYCPAGWQLFELSCYLLSSDAQNWQESSNWCRKQNGHLAVINSNEEQTFLQNKVKVPSWIGLSDIFFEGDWRWVDGTPYDTTPQLWSSSQPDNQANEDCVTLSPLTEWNDNQCSKLFSSICERRASQFTLEGNKLSN